MLPGKLARTVYEPAWVRRGGKGRKARELGSTRVGSAVISERGSGVFETGGGRAADSGDGGRGGEGCAAVGAAGVRDGDRRCRLGDGEVGELRGA